MVVNEYSVIAFGVEMDRYSDFSGIDKGGPCTPAEKNIAALQRLVESNIISGEDKLAVLKKRIDDLKDD